MIMPSIRDLMQNYIFLNTENVFHKIIEFCCFIHEFTHYSIPVFHIAQLLQVLGASYERMLNYYKVIRLVCKDL